MAFTRPTPVQLRDRIAAEFDVLFEGADPRRKRSVEGVMTRVLALVSHEMHGHIQWASRQMHIGTADGDELPVRAEVYGMTFNDPVAARGPVTVQGTPGRTVPALAELRRTDDTRYSFVADCTIGVGGTATGQVVAVQAGSAGNAVAGTNLALIEPVDGVQSAVAVAPGGLGGGLDKEEAESLRARTKQRLQKPPAGGAKHDYEAWVKDVVGDTRVWVKPTTPALGWVTVYFLMPDGSIPDAGTVATVAAAIEVVRPVSAAGVNLPLLVEQLVPFSVALSPDTLAIRGAVVAALDDLLVREAEPGGTIPHSRISAAISSALGETSHTLSVPSGDIVSPAGQVARRGVVTWL